MRNLFRLTFAITAAAILAAPLGAATRLAGRVDTLVRAGATASPAVVYAEPLDTRAPSRPGVFTMLQKDKSFQPRMLAVPNGSTIKFRNVDDIFHNVFSLSRPQPFDLGMYRSGASQTKVFTQPAVYHVFCDIHPQMAAWVVVSPSPFVTTAGAGGAWELDVPPGRYRVTTLSEHAAPTSMEIKVDANANAPLVLTLDESAFVQTSHTNKIGKPYSGPDYTGR